MTDKIYCVNCSKFEAGEVSDKYGRCLDKRAQYKQPESYRYISAEYDTPPEQQYACVIRESDTNCGPDAKWFEAK